MTSFTFVGPSFFSEHDCLSPLSPARITTDIFWGKVGALARVIFHLSSVWILHINKKINKLISGIDDTVNVEGLLLGGK